MDSKAVNKELRAVVRPLLQAHGFHAFTARTAWRSADHRIDVVNFQSFNSYLAASIGSTTFSFALNFGIYLLSVPADAGREARLRDGEVRPEEYECHLRLHPVRGIDQAELPRKDIWYIDEQGVYLTAAVRDAHRVISVTGLRWFERWTDDAILHALQTAPEIEMDDGTNLPGRLGSISRNYVTGYFARHLNERALAQTHLSRALEQYEAMDKTNAEILGRRFQPSTPSFLRADVAELFSAV